MKPDYGLVWNALPTPALVVDADGTIIDVSGTAEGFLGLSARQMCGNPLARFAGEDSRIVDLVRDSVRRGTPMAEYNIEFAWPDSPPRLIDLHVMPMGENGRSAEPGVIVLINPRTIAESMDRSLSHRNAARSVAGMAAMVAHEIKNPLAGISGAAQLLEMNVDEEDRELAILIREEAERIGTLIGRVEQFGEIGPGRYRPVNIHDVLDRACRSARAGFAQHLRFIEDYDPSLPPTLGDADQLMQVMQNLLKNASEATPRVGGILTVRTSYRAGLKVVVPGGRRESLPLQILIADNGGGIPAEMQRHIFEPFVTSKAAGSGLGLALVSKIVADHGGVISCESEPGWTEFRMLLPVASAAETEETGSRENAA